MANEQPWRLYTFSAAQIDIANRDLPTLGAKMKRIKVEFSNAANAAEQNQRLMDLVEQHCRRNLYVFHMIGFRPMIEITTRMSGVEYLLIRDSVFRPGNLNFVDLFPNVRYLELRNIEGTSNDLGHFLGQFQHLENVWLDCSSNFTNRIIKTFLEQNTNLAKLTLEFSGDRMTKYLLKGIDDVKKNLRKLTILPAIPAHQQKLKYEAKLFQELEEFNILGYFDSTFDLFSYLSISNENVIRMDIEASDLNTITMSGINYYVFLQELTISALKGFTFQNLIALVENLTGLQKIQIIIPWNNNVLQNDEDFLNFIRRFDRMNEFILKDVLPHDYTETADVLRNELDDAVWTVQHRNRAIRVHKTQNDE